MSTPARVVYYPSPGKVYSKEEMAEIFSKFSVLDPVAMALRQIFQERFAAAAIEASQPKLTEREAGIAAGRIQEVTDFREELIGYFGGAVAATGEVKKTEPKRTSRRGM